MTNPTPYAHLPPLSRQTYSSSQYVVFTPTHLKKSTGIKGERMRKEMTCASKIIMTTEKDGVRLADFPDFLKDVFFLRMEMEMHPSREEFEAPILEKLK